MDAPAPSFPCATLGGSQAVVRLRCLRRFVAQGGITAHLDGMELGGLALEGVVAPGTELALPLRRLPRVALPAALRFSTAAGTAEVAPPLALADAAAATALFGPGLWRTEAVEVAQGVVQGRLLNAANGLAEPVGFARLNASQARPLLLGQPVTLPEGGVCWPFQLALLAEDLLDSGLTLALHVAGQEAPLASLAWARGWAGEEAARLVALEARLQEVEQAAAARAAQLAAELRHAQAQQQARLDAFLEYAGALLLDRMAGTASSPGAEPAGLAALRAMVAAAVPSQAEAPAPEAAPQAIGLHPGSALFSFGWHEVECDAGGEFRWMGATGVVANPAPHRLVAGVVVELRHVYGVAAPVLRARLDGAAATVALEGAPGGFRLRLTPAGLAPCRSLRLESPHAGSPARDGLSADPRVLSVAVARVVFSYAD